MTRYFSNFDESTQTVGSNLAGWTVRTGGAPGRVPAIGNPATLAFQKKYLSYTNDSTVTSRVLSWDAIDGDSQRDNIDVLTAICMPLTDAQVATLYARLQLSGTTIQYAYRLRLDMNAGTIYFDKWHLAGIYAANIANVAHAFGTTKTWMIRWRVNGTTLGLKIWDAALGAAGEPVNWTLMHTDSSVTGQGYFALDGYSAAATGKVTAFNFVALTTENANALRAGDQFADSAWTNTSTTITSNAIVDARGKLKADLLTSGGSGSRMTQSFTAWATSHYFEIEVKKGVGSSCTVLFYNSTTATTLCNVTVNFDTGQQTIVTGSAQAMVTLGNGWFLVVLYASSGITVGDLLIAYQYAGTSGSSAGDAVYATNARCGRGTTYEAFEQAPDVPMINTEFTALLRNPSKQLAVLAELSATGYDAASSPYTKVVNWYISNHPFTSRQQDSPSVQEYDALITSVPTFRREMSSALSGAAQTGFGDLVLTNPAGRLVHEKYTALDLNYSGANYVYAASSSSLNFGTGSFSVWLRGRFDDFTNPRSFPSFGKQGTTWNTTAGWGIGAGYSATSVYAFFHDGTNFVAGYITLDAGYRPTDLVGQFVEILVIVNRTANTVRIMVNGVLQSGSLSIAALTGSVSNAQQFQFGNCVGWYHEGLVDEVRVWSRALTQAEGVNLYRRRGGESDTNLALLWPFNEGTGSSITDKSGNANTGTVNGAATWVSGTRTLVNNEDRAGLLDQALRMRWRRNYVRIYVGDPTRPKHDMRLMVLGRLGLPTAPSENTIVFPIADLSDVFNVPIQTSKFSSGLRNGEYKPTMLGRHYDQGSCEPPKTDTLTYTLHSAAIGTNFGNNASDLTVYDNGVELITTAKTVTAVNAATDTLTCVGHGLKVDATVLFYTGTPPAPLVTNTEYFVISAGFTADDFRLSATLGGAAINITGGAGGTFEGYLYVLDKTAATVRLLSTPNGRITVGGFNDNVGSKISDLYATAVFTLMGLSLNFKDSASFSALASHCTIQDFMAGLWLEGGRQVTVAEALQRIASQTGTWYGITPDGLMQVGIIDHPTGAYIGTSVMTITESDIVKGSMRMVDIIRAVDFRDGIFSYEPLFGNAGAVPNSDPYFLRGKRIFAYNAPNGVGIPLDSYPEQWDSTRTRSVDTIFQSDSGIEHHLDQQVNLFKQTLGVFEFETLLPAMQLNIGELITVQYPRMGWKNYTKQDPASPDNYAAVDSTKAVVLATDSNVNARRVRVKCMRRIPGFYPTADLN